MGNWFSTEVGLGLLRTILLSGGVVTAVSGYFTGTQWADAVGLLISLLSVILSAWSNKGKADAVSVVKAVEAHPRLSVIPASMNATNKPLIEIAPQPVPGGLATPLGHS